MPTFYPLLFEPALFEKVWGGRQFESRLDKPLPPDQPIGESWEVFWKNHVANGEFRGKTLGELIRQYPQEMTGSAKADPEFPLLIKFIDAQDWLSVQVHPDDARAAELEGQPRGKTECWYIIDAAPDSQIAYGFAEPLDAESYRKAIEAGRSKETLQFVNVAPGDFIYLPAGQIHAIGPGILLYELQQTSDTTYRVYDWDRMGLDGKPRELHLDKALKCIDFSVQPPAKVNYAAPDDAHGIGMTTLINGKYFSLDKLSFNGPDLDSITFEPQNKARTLTVTAGRVTLYDIESKVPPTTLSRGQSAFLPAALGRYQIEFTSASEVLRAWSQEI